MGVKVKEVEGVGFLYIEGGFEDGDGDDKVGGEGDLFVVVDGEVVGGELLVEDVEGGGDVGDFRLFVDDVVVGVGFDEVVGGGVYCRVYVGDVEVFVVYIIRLVGKRR